MSLSLTVNALQVNAAIALLASVVPRRAARALTEEAEMIMAEAKNIVPVDTGALRASGVVKPAVVTPGNISIALEFGGSSITYAAIVHEDPDAQHAEGRTFKYLERPLIAASSGMGRRIAPKILFG